MKSKDSKNEKPCTLDSVSGGAFLEEIQKQMEKYENKHSHVGIMTCDVADVYDWLRKAEKKVLKKHCH
jgi:hypothetical protein